MEPCLIRDVKSGSAACVAAHIGFNCFDFRPVVDGRIITVLDASAEFRFGKDRPNRNGIPILFPYPNRIRAGRFCWQGTEYELSDAKIPFDAAGNAIHGFCLDRPWRVVGRSEDSVEGEFQLSRDAPERLDSWPADFIVRLRYSVRGATLSARFTLINPSDVPLPWGLGTHPYFRLPLAEESRPQGCLIETAATEAWELRDCLPTGKRMPVSADRDLREGVYFGTVALDDVLTGLPADVDYQETIIYDEAAGLQVSQRCDPLFRELVVYNPPGRDVVCLEPYTCVTDAVNLAQRGIDCGWQVLAAGAEVRIWFEIEAGPILV